MVVDAEEHTGAVLAMDNDQRITKAGALMRATRIDEIPQFFNVLTGSMSLVGPRPERPVFVEEYCRRYPEYYCRLAVKPGITGLAQVKGSYTTSAEKKMKFDLIYIINYSFLLDLKILFQTVRVVLNREKAKGIIQNENIYFIPAEDTDQNDKKSLPHVVRIQER
jgi:lipopolysaccharide/colanic/teichoic acid biosynthesis glycosyltransferase